MSTIAAFYWNVTDKYISYMVLDDETYSIKIAPVLKECYGDTFESKARNAIDEYFKIIEKEQRKNNNIILKHKIIAPATKIVRHYGYTNPSVETGFVDGYYKEKLKLVGIKSERVHSCLKKPELNEFKKILKGLHFLDKLNSDAYKHRVWAVAIGATKKTYKEVIKPYWNSIIKPECMKKELGLLYQAWIQQL